MNDLDKELNKLPQFKLRKKADILIRLRLLSVSALEAFTLIGGLMRQAKFQTVTAVLILLSLIISIPGYAYASPGVTKGHWLYPVKLNLEGMELNLKTTPETQAVTLAKFTERRLEEAAHLSSKEETEEETITATINKALEYDQASQEMLLTITQPELKEEASKKIEERKEDQLKALSAVAQDIGLSSEEETLDTITFALETVRDLPDKTPWGHFKKQLPLSQDKIKEPPIIPPGQAKKLKQNYEDVIKDINELDEGLREKKYDQTDIKALYERLGKKLEESEEQIEEGNLESAKAALKSTKALTKTAEYFVKEKKEKPDSRWQKKKKTYNKDENEDEGEVENDYSENFWEYYENKNKKITPGQLKKNN